MPLEKQDEIKQYYLQEGLVVGLDYISGEKVLKLAKDKAFKLAKDRRSRDLNAA
jgi:hypothetical protein